MTATGTQIIVSRTIDASAKDLFALLTLPARHPEFDGSGTVRSAEDTERITKSGQTFVMTMDREAMGGEYRMHNHVSAYAENQMVGWKPAPDDDPERPFGWEWFYELRPLDAHTTEVVLTYDWTGVTDEKLLQRVGFPAIPREDLEESLNLLAAAVSGS